MTSHKIPVRRSACIFALLGFLALTALPAPAAGSRKAASHAAPANDEPQQGIGKPKTVEIPFKSYDGYEMFGKLTVPASSGSHAVVIYVQTAEAATVDVKVTDGRGGTFNYFDLYRTKLPQMNVAFFGYEGR